MEAELIRKIFELSLTMGARETSKELAKQGIKISHRKISDILLKTYPDEVVPVEIQKLSKEAREKRKKRIKNTKKNSQLETFKTLRAALIKCIIQKRELQKEILRLRTSNEALSARISELEAELEERRWSEEENLW